MPQLLPPQRSTISAASSSGAARGIHREHVAGELVAEPGLLSLGVLAGARRDRLRHRLARPATVQILHRLPHADAVESGRVGRMPLGQHRRHLLDQTAPNHLLGPADDPLVQHGARNREHNVPGVDRAPRAGQPPANRTAGGPVSSATSIARAARCRPPPRNPGSSRLAQRSSSSGSSRAVTRIQRAAPRRIESGFAKQPLGQRPDVEAGATHHHRQLPPAPDLLEPARRHRGRSGRRCSARPGSTRSMP